MINKHKLITENHEIIEEVQDILTQYEFALRDKTNLQIVLCCDEREKEIDELRAKILQTKSLLVQHQAIALQLGGEG